MALITVVVGNVVVVEANELPHVWVLAVPLSRIRISRKSPSRGVPVKPEVMEVMSVLIAGVAEDAIDVTLRVIREETLLAVTVPFTTNALALSVPATSSLVDGAVVPMPTLPLVSRYNWPSFVPLFVKYPDASINGLIVPEPDLPVARTLNVPVFLRPQNS